LHPPNHAPNHPPDELSPQDITLVDHHVVLLLLPNSLLIGLVDDVIQLFNLGLLGGYCSISLLDLHLGLVELHAKGLLFLLHLEGES